MCVCVCVSARGEKVIVVRYRHCSPNLNSRLHFT